MASAGVTKLMWSADAKFTVLQGYSYAADRKPIMVFLPLYCGDYTQSRFVRYKLLRSWTAS